MTPAPRPNSVVNALRRELQKLVDGLDARYRRNHSAPAADDPYRDVRTARDLGGAGNFGSRRDSD